MKGALYCLSLCLLLMLASPTVVAQTVQQKEMISSDTSVIELTVTTDSIRIQNAKVGSVMEIYNILGVKINSFTIDSTDKTIPLTLPKGYYIFKIYTVVRKIIIK